MKSKLAPLFAGATLIASSLSPQLQAATTNLVKDTQVSAIVKPAWLREYLPESTLLYARIPSLWSGASYKEDSFKYALGNPNYTRALKAIQQAGTEWVEQADQKIRPLLSLLIGQLNGPIEIAAVAGGITPKVLVSASLNVSSNEQLQNLIDSLLAAKLVRSEAQKMQDGAGILVTDLGPTPYRWNEQKRRLEILFNFGGADLATLAQTFDTLVKNPNSPMLANEQLTDSSQQGLYLWYNNQKTYPMYQAMIPQHIQQQLQMFGVPDMQSLSLSWGVRNDKGRIKLMLEAPTSGMVRSLIPTNNNSVQIATAGKPKFAALLALPSVQQFSKIEQMLMQMSANANSYTAAKTQAQQALGFSIEEVLSAVGPEITTVFDDSGEYLAMRIKDRARFANIIEKVQAKPNVSLIEKEVAGHSISYLKLPSMFDEKSVTELKDLPFFMKDLMTKVSTHLYWQIEGDFLILADLPQVLIDRKKLISNNNLQEWLAKDQKQDLSASTLALSGSLTDAPRRIYYAYLNILHMLADLTGAQIDTFSLPSAQQLSLLDQGTLGFQIDSSERDISLEFTFESTPADILFSGQGVAAIAGVGMAAAVALPAYQDYTLKSKATSSLYVAVEAKRQIERVYAEQGRYPNQQESAAIKESIGYRREFKIQLEPDSGKITITLNPRRNKRIELIPKAKVNSIEWQCQTNLSGNARPSNCHRSLR